MPLRSFLLRPVCSRAGYQAGRFVRPKGCHEAGLSLFDDGGGLRAHHTRRMARRRPQVSAPDMARQQGHRSDRDKATAAGSGRYKGGRTALPDLTACGEIYFVGV
jgi:hypothetical protein